MVSNPSLPDLAMQLFLEEVPDLLQTLETELLSLRQERTTAKVHALMRAAHTLKGGAASVGLTAIQSIAHRLEDCFSALHHEALSLDADLEGLLLQSQDCLRLPLMQQILTGEHDAEQTLQQAEPILSQIEARIGSVLGKDPGLPSSVDLGVDMAQSVFEVDIAADLERLTQLMHQEQVEDLRQQLRTCSVTFVELAEILELPGFGEIAQATLAALESHPDQILQIAKVALADLHRGQQAVLSGDRERGGEVSAALRQLTPGGTDLATVERAQGGEIIPISEDLEAISAVFLEDARPDLFAPPLASVETISSTPLTIRVERTRLDRMTNQTGELTISRNSLGLHHRQLRRSCRDLRARIANLVKLGHQMQILSEKRSRSLDARVTFSPLSSPLQDLALPQFDPLEWDRYGDSQELLHSLVTELAELEAKVESLTTTTQRSEQELERHEQVLTDLRQDLMSARMLPLEQVFNRLPRLVRDLSTTLNKPVVLTIKGKEV